MLIFPLSAIILDDRTCYAINFVPPPVCSSPPIPSHMLRAVKINADEWNKHNSSFDPTSVFCHSDIVSQTI